VDDGAMSIDDYERVRDKYLAWKSFLMTAKNQYSGAKLPAGFMTKAPAKMFESTKPPAPKPVKEVRAEVIFDKSGSLAVKKTVNGHVVSESKQLLHFPGSEYRYVDLAPGVQVRYWQERGTPFAARGQLQVVVDGTGAAASEKALSALEKLGVPTARSTDLDAEELYLRQIVYRHATEKSGLKSALDKVEEISGQQERVEFMKSAVSRELLGGKPVDKLPGYDPRGTHQAFEQGRRHLMDPVVEKQPGWELLRRDYVLFHTLSTTNVENALDSILSSGGQMAPTVDKLRRGIQPSGMSPGQDMNTGGASYFFTRVAERRNVRPGGGVVVWKPSHLRRLDAISYDGDRYGQVSGDGYVLSHRKSSPEKVIEAARNSSNETIFKNGLSLFDDLEAIFTANQQARQKVIELLRRHKIERWPDGRSLEEVVKVSGDKL